MRKGTTKDIIKDWLGYKILSNNKVVKSHEFEIDLVKYGELYWGVKKLPSAYSRAWRSMREHNEYTDVSTLLEVKKLQTKGAEGVWELITST